MRYSVKHKLHQTTVQIQCSSLSYSHFCSSPKRPDIIFFFFLSVIHLHDLFLFDFAPECPRGSSRSMGNASEVVCLNNGGKIPSLLLLPKSLLYKFWNVTGSVKAALQNGRLKSWSMCCVCWYILLWGLEAACCDANQGLGFEPQPPNQRNSPWSRDLLLKMLIERKRLRQVRARAWSTYDSHVEFFLIPVFRQHCLGRANMMDRCLSCISSLYWTY